MRRRADSIVVTGIGLVTPLGCSREKTWQHVREGRSVVDVQNAENYDEDFKALVRAAPFINPNGNHRIFPLSLTAVHEALHDAGLDLSEVDPERTACSFSVSKPVFSSMGRLPEAPDSIGRYLLKKLGISGPARNVVAACATGVHSILASVRWLEEGLCDVAIAGSGESSLNPLIISGFKNLGVLSDFPCPFDKRRKGFVMGEGSGALILEKRKDALARDAQIYAEVAACSVGSDVSHPTRFSSDGSSIASVISRAMNESGLGPSDLHYVNLHGTGTNLNDVSESKALKRVFGKGAYGISMSSTKASTGHLLGAAGSVEAGIACLALRDQIVPPTANLEVSDPECDLDYTPLRGKSRGLKTAMSLSFGFGGPIGAVIFKSP